MSEQLAILGGTPAITMDSVEQWKRPIAQEKELIDKLLDDGFLSGAGIGLCQEFEDAFRAFLGVEYCVTTDHGTTALESAYFAVGVGPGDEIIQPTYTWICSYSGAMTHMGARPVFCDIDPHTLLIDPADVERKITSRTRAIVAVHMNGNICDMERLTAIGRKHGIAVIEDVAHATGAEWDGHKVGTIGDVGCFSLQGTNPGGKPVSGGEGGVVVTNKREIYERLLIATQLNRTGLEAQLTNPEYRKLGNRALGIKARAHPLALAVATVSLSTVAYRNQRREENWRYVSEALSELPGLEPARAYAKAKPSGFYGNHPVIYHPEQLGGLSMERFVAALQAEGAPVSGQGLAIEHLLPIFTEGFDLWGNGRGPLRGEFMGLPAFRGYAPGDLPVAEDLATRVLTLPPYIEPIDGFLDQYTEAFRKVTRNYQSLL